MTFAIIAFICRWRPAHSKRRGGCAVGPFADALIILTVKHKQISTYLAVKHKQKCLPTGCSRGLNGSAFSRISTAVAQLRVGTQLQDRPSPPVQAHHASLHPVSSCSFKFDWRTLCSTKWRRSAGSSSRAASNPSRIRRLRHPPRLHMLTKSPCPSLLGR